MTGFTDIALVRVPLELTREVQTHLRDMGRRGSEGVAFWAGRRQVQVFDVLATLIPAQTGFRASAGIGVRVDGDELFRMNVWLHQNRMQLIAQLHSHPGEAYHSVTDDEYAIMTTVGGLSIVIPDFGRGDFSLERCAVYRLDAQGEWEELSHAYARSLIKLTEE